MLLRSISRGDAFASRAFFSVPFLRLGLCLLLGVTIACSGCSGGGNNSADGGSNNGGGGAPAPQIKITSVSSSTPMALTPLYLSTSGLNTSAPFAVTISGGQYTAVIPPIRTQSDGTVVIATPLYFDPSTGTTSSASASITISQGAATSSPVSLSIQDIPQLSAYGTSLGQISRAFYNYQQISLGLEQNGLQAIQHTRNNTVDTTTLQGHVATQLHNAILARSDVDRIITNNSTQIGTGTLPDGKSISFNSNSVQMMDRVVGMYLTALQPEFSAAITSSINRSHRSRGARAQRNSITITPLDNFRPIRSPRQQLTSDEANASLSPRLTVPQILTGLGVVGNVENVVTAIRTDLDTKSNFVDRFLATQAGVYGAIGVYGGVVALATGTAPAIAATAFTAGLIVSAAMIGNDIYHTLTDPNAVLAASNSGGNSSTLTNVLNYMKSPQGTLLGDGVGQLFGAVTKQETGVNVTSLGTEVQNFLQSNGAQVGIQGAAFVNSTTQLLASFFGSNAQSNDQNTAQNAASQYSTVDTSLNQGFGTVTGKVTIGNSEGPILSGLTGMLLYDPGSGMQLNDMADVNGDYEVIVPLGNTTINYSDDAIYAYDPITTANNNAYDILSSTAINLSGLTSSGAFAGPSLSGTCSDTDAANPDADDPDCD